VASHLDEQQASQALCSVGLQHHRAAQFDHQLVDEIAHAWHDGVEHRVCRQQRRACAFTGVEHMGCEVDVDVAARRIFAERHRGTGWREEQRVAARHEAAQRLPLHTASAARIGQRH
jgi:hypothetical protein